MADGAHSGSAMPDPIHQFEINRLWHIDLFGFDASFTNSALFMVVAVALIVGFLLYAISGRLLVPSRVQSLAETAYEFIANMVRESMGEQGMKFFPLVFTIFMFIFTVNMLGMVPGFFTVTSHVAVTAALALLVFTIVLLVGFAKNGLGFLRLFVPSGVPVLILPFVTMIEVISFISRPISHSIRLFANMLGGHITLEGFRRLHRDAARIAVCRRQLAGSVAARWRGGADGTRIPGRLPAGLRLHDADLHVSQRRAASWPLGFAHFFQPITPIHPRGDVSMDPASAKLIGAGLAAIGTGAAAIGVGNLFGQFLQGALRNPSAADGQFGRLIFGFAVTEALGIFAFVVALLLLFAV